MSKSDLIGYSRSHLAATKSRKQSRKPVQLAGSRADTSVLHQVDSRQGRLIENTCRRRLKTLAHHGELFLVGSCTSEPSANEKEKNEMTWSFVSGP